MPSTYSRDRYCFGLFDGLGNLYLSDPAPVRFQVRADNISHVIIAGETWETIALAEYGRPEVAHVLADYQPEPVIDMTIELIGGSELILPSPRMMYEEIFNDERREEHDA